MSDPEKTIETILKKAGVYTLDLELELLRYYEKLLKANANGS